jgi:hypothetical protein
MPTTRRKRRALEREKRAPKRAGERASRSPGATHPTPTRLQALQRAIGNRAVGGLLVQRQEPEEDIVTARTPPVPAPVPTPYPNVSATGGASQTSSKVTIADKQAVTGSSEVTRSSGDEAGTLKGMRSMATMEPTSTASPPGVVLTPSQAKVVLEDE